MAKTRRAALEKGEANGEKVPNDELINSASPVDDASWLPPSRGYTAEADAVEKEREQGPEDKIPTQWPQVRNGLVQTMVMPHTMKTTSGTQHSGINFTGVV